MVICDHNRGGCLFDDFALLHTLKSETMKNYKLLVLTFLVTVISHANVFAQCAMCKAVTKSDLDGGGNISNGINSGILYLMLIPYIILMIGGYFFFRKPIDAKVKEWKTKFFASKQTHS